MHDLIHHFAKDYPEIYGPLLLVIFGLFGLAVEKFYAPETEVSP